MKPTELKKRWDSGPGANFLAWLIKEVATGCEITSSPFGIYDSRIDLRCLTFSPKVNMRRVKMNDVDMSGGVLNGAWIEACCFENVIFDSVSAVKIADHGNRFVGCSFVGTNLRDAAIGYRGSMFQQVKFVNVDFRRAIFIRPEFDDVAFADCRFEGIDFNAASFRNCTFSGEVKDVWFRGKFALPTDNEQFGYPRPNTMEGVSFKEARLSGVTFSDECDLTAVTLPADGSCWRFDNWKLRLAKLLEFAATQPSAERKEIEIFCRSHLVHAPWQDTYILSINDVQTDFGIDVANLIVNMLKHEWQECN